MDCWNSWAEDLRCHIGIIAQMAPGTGGTSGLQTSDAIMGPPWALDLRCHIMVNAQKGPWTVNIIGLRTSGAILENCTQGFLESLHLWAGDLRCHIKKLHKRVLGIFTPLDWGPQMLYWEIT